MSQLEDALLLQIRAARLPLPQREVRVVDGRRFRWDLAWPDRQLACEVHGGVFTGGRHVRGAGITRDCEKVSLATLAGWRVLLVTAAHIRDGQALDWIQHALDGET